MVDVAVVGAGFWGVNHIRVLKELGEAEVVAVCDVDIERARKAAARFGVGNTYSDVDTMLKETHPDAVTICTPSTTHAELALKLLDHGCDLLIEKPMASTVDEAVKILEKNRESGRVVMVGFIERFNPAVQFARRLIEEKEVGDVLLFYGRRIGWWPERIGDTGVVKDTAIHDLDLVTWIFRTLPDEVYGMCGRLRHSYEDHAQIFLSYGEGRSALLEANWLTPRKKREMHITGENGVISVKFIEQEVVVEKAEQTIIPHMKTSEPLRNELKHFIESVKDHSAPAVTAHDGFNATLLAECVLESAKNRSPINPRRYITALGHGKHVETI
ncbi:MAG: Gfo/Idh/MocA family oxidoreductase [Candidatus Caldarchaeum sp.]